MQITKTQKIVAASVAAIALIAGGVTYKKHTDEVARKEAARIAYENRPIIAESCVMNGYGKGSCDFTNTGKTSGAICGSIQVDGPGTATSNQFCSGQVGPMSTEKVEFNIPVVDELCDNGFESWTKKCSFSFNRVGVEA